MFRLSLTGHVASKNLDPAMKCWATFISIPPGTVALPPKIAGETEEQRLTPDFSISIGISPRNFF
jgi:hypothetical protein